VLYIAGEEQGVYKFQAARIRKNGQKRPIAGQNIPTDIHTIHYMRVAVRF
jgi:hypothetical protein